MTILAKGRAYDIAEAKMACMPADCNGNGVMPCAER